jgi:hypothetical protein
VNFNETGLQLDSGEAPSYMRQQFEPVRCHQVWDLLWITHIGIEWIRIVPRNSGRIGRTIPQHVRGQLSSRRPAGVIVHFVGICKHAVFV